MKGLNSASKRCLLNRTFLSRLDLLCINKLHVKREKCLLYQKEVTFCGSTISGAGIKPTTNARDEIGKMTRPTTVKEVRSFLGSLNYFRQFIESFATISAPLSNLTKKYTPWEWTSDHENAFILLKECLTTAPMLHHFDVEKETIIHTDASLYAIGGWIGQRHGTEIKPIANWSKKLNPAETRYPTHERELMALVKICEKFEHLLAGRQVVAMTDHRALVTSHPDKAGGWHCSSVSTSESTIFPVPATTSPTISHDYPCTSHSARNVGLK